MKKVKEYRIPGLVCFLLMIITQSVGAWGLLLNESKELDPISAHFIDDTTFMLLCSSKREEPIPYDPWGRSYKIPRVFIYKMATDGSILSFAEHYIDLNKYAERPGGGFFISGIKTTEEHKEGSRDGERILCLDENGNVLWDFAFVNREVEYRHIEILKAGYDGGLIAVSTVSNRDSDEHFLQITKIDAKGNKVAENSISEFPGKISWMIEYTVDFIEILPDGYRLSMTEWWDSHDCETFAWIVRTDLRGKVLFSNKIQESELPCLCKIADNAYYCGTPNTNSVIIDSMGERTAGFWGKEIRAVCCLPCKEGDFAVLSGLSFFKGDRDSLFWKKEYGFLLENSNLTEASGRLFIEKPEGGFIVFATGKTIENLHWRYTKVLWIFDVDPSGDPEINREASRETTANVHLVNNLDYYGCSWVHVKDEYCFTLSLPNEYRQMDLDYKMKYPNRHSKLSCATLFSVLDMTNPLSVKTINRFRPSTYKSFKDIVFQDSFGYAITTSQGNLADFIAFDFSDLRSPFETTVFQTRRKFSAIAVQGHYAYLLNSDKVFSIMDISSPEKYNIVGFDTTIGISADKMVIDSSFVYIAAKEEGLRVYDVFDPFGPFEVGKLNTPGKAEDICIDSATIFIADGYGGLRIIDISNLYDPKFVGFYQNGEYFNSVYLENRFAYVTTSDFGLRIIDINDPAKPFEIGRYATNGIPMDAFVNLTTAFVADYDSGLYILDLSDIE